MGGVGQWRKAVENAQKSKEWTVHISDQLAGIFDGAGFTKSSHAELNLTEEVRFHLVTRIHEFVDGVIQDTAPEGLEQIAAELSKNTYPVYLTRDLEKAKEYVRERYYEDKNARYGMLASARDKFLPGFGVLNLSCSIPSATAGLIIYWTAKRILTFLPPSQKPWPSSKRNSTTGAPKFRPATAPRTTATISAPSRSNAPQPASCTRLIC